MAEKPEAARTGTRDELILPPHPPTHEPTETASIAGGQSFSVQSRRQPSTLFRPGLIDEACRKSRQGDMQSADLKRGKMTPADIGKWVSFINAIV